MKRLSSLLCILMLLTLGAVAENADTGAGNTGVQKPNTMDGVPAETAHKDAGKTYVNAEENGTAGEKINVQQDEDAAFDSTAEEQTGADAAAQNDDEQKNIVYKANQSGDQYIILKLNVDIPYRPFKQLLVGGSGTIGYHRFVTENLTLGGGLSFGYSKTIGSNVFYFVPILFRAGWQFTAGKFEIPLSLGIGGSFENYIDRTYFGFTLHPDVAVFFRYNTSWSFGLHPGVFILPQWYKNTEHNYTGIIQDIGLTVRYHL